MSENQAGEDAGSHQLLIAHRLSTVKRANRILVIEHGKITEAGSHAELLRARGHYYRLYTQQFRREREVEYGVMSAHTQRALSSTA